MAHILNLLLTLALTLGAPYPDAKTLSHLWRDKPVLLFPLATCDAPLPHIDEPRINVAGVCKGTPPPRPVLIDTAGILRRLIKDSASAEVHAWFDGMAIYRAQCARCHGDDGSDTTYPGIHPLTGIGNHHTEEQILDMTQRAGFVDLHSLDEKSRRALAIYVAGL